MTLTNILIIGDARHGKDTVAEIIKESTGMCFTSSSQAAADIFIYDLLKDKYKYANEKECFEDRVNHREEWFSLISEYNKNDKARLAKEILKGSDIYVGMRDEEELKECIRQSLFYLILGVYDYRKPKEGKESFNIPIGKYCDFVICNNGTIEQLKEKVLKLRL